MSNTLLTDNYTSVVDILSRLGLSDDDELKRNLSLVEIEINGSSVIHDGVTRAEAAQLELLHFDQINASLHTIVRSALGYYALAEQPIGTNEPTIGPNDAIALLNKFQDKKLYPYNDINQIKDEIFKSLARNRNEKRVD